MQPDKFTIKSQEAIQAAQQLAHERGNPEIAPEHLLAVLLEQEGGIVAPILTRVGVPLESLRAELNALLDKLPTVSGAAASEARPAGELVRVFQRAESEAQALEEVMESMQQQLERLRGEARAMEAEMRQRIAEVHRSYKRELVPWQRPGQMVRVQDADDRAFRIPIQRNRTDKNATR